jgi:hypothetical protein
MAILGGSEFGLHDPRTVHAFDLVHLDVDGPENKVIGGRVRPAKRRIAIWKRSQDLFLLNNTEVIVW